MLQQLCDRLQCYMAILSPSLSLTPASALFFYHFFSLLYAETLLFTCTVMTLFSVCHSLSFFFHSSSSSSELCALPVFSLLPCPVCVFMSLPCCPHALPFSNSHHSLCRRCQSACLLCMPNHFALLMFQGAGTLAGDMEVHLTKHEQARRHRLHNTPVPHGWGLKPQQRGIIFFHKHCIMVHWCRVVASQFVDSHL